MKPGFKTTEFAFAVLFAVLALLGAATGMIKDPTLATVAVAIVSAAYSIARGLAKQHGVEPPASPIKPGQLGQ